MDVASSDLWKILLLHVKENIIILDMIKSILKKKTANITLR